MKLYLVVAVLVAFYSMALVLTKERNDKPYKVVCYYQPDFPAEQINLNICTHINYAFALLVNGTIQLDNPKRDLGPNGMINRTLHLRTLNPHLTVMMSLGGWCEGSTKYSQMVRSEATRKVFVDSAVAFLTQHDFDGLDFDWEYPGFAGDGCDDRTEGREEDKQDYITLLTELKAAFKPHDLLLTAAIAAGRTEFERAYDLATLSAHLDFINLMTYDYHGAYDNHTAHNAPAYLDPKASRRDQELTMQYTVDYFLRNGTDPKKIILGIPLYGHIYKLANVTDYGVGAPVIGTGREQRAYNKLCVEFLKAGWNIHWDAIAQVPYAVNGDQWISFDNLTSVEKKLDYVLEKKLGGSMVWSVDLDDSKNLCGQGAFPLMKIQMKKLNNIDTGNVFAPAHTDN